MVNTNLQGGALLSAKQTSERLGISRAKLSRIKNQIGFYRIGRNIKFREESIANFLKNVECAPLFNNDHQLENGGDE